MAGQVRLPGQEVLTPIQQAIFYFTEDEYRASKGPKKPILILARPCDINAQHVQAKIYAGNGGYTDLYYERMREKVKFALMECNGGDDTCFCVSMGTNKTDDYSLALKFSDEGVQVQVTDETFAPYFEGMPQAGYTPAFVEENELKVTVPELDDKAVRLALKSHPMWKEFDGRCISWRRLHRGLLHLHLLHHPRCHLRRQPRGGRAPPRHRLLPDRRFRPDAGQREFRSTAGERMRYKVLHKFRDYKARFGEGHMCVGCGRCTHRCPELISISATVNKVNAAVNEIKAGLAQQ